MRKRLKWLGGIAALITALGAGVVITAGSASAATGLTSAAPRSSKATATRSSCAASTTRTPGTPTRPARSPTSRRSARTPSGSCWAAASAGARATDVANVDLAVQGQQADLRPGGARHHRVRRGQRGRHPRRGGRLLDQPARRAWSARRTTSSSTSATSRTATPTPPPGPPPPPPRSRSCAAAASSTRSWSTRPNWGQDWQFVMRDNAATVFAADTAEEHHLLDPHVRRLRHRRRGHRLPGPLPDARPAARGRRVRLQPLRRQPRRGHHHGHRAVARASATSAGPGAATAAASNTSTMVTGFNAGAADHLGPAALQRRQRHQGHLQARPRSTAAPTTTPPTTTPTTPPTTTADDAPDHAADDAAHHAAGHRRLHRHLRGDQLVGRRLPGRGHGHRRPRRDQRLDGDLDLAQRPDASPTPGTRR